VGLLACALLAVSPAAAGGSASTKTYRFRVVAVTHASSSRKERAPQYTGSSSSSWQLAPAAKRASNTITVTIGPGSARGLGRINVRGTFTAQATSSSRRPRGACSLTARTGSQQYAAVAPGRFTLTFAQSPKVKARARAVIGLRGAVYATLGNPYFPLECKTSLTGEPPAAATHIALVTKTKLAQRVLTLVYGGKRSKAGITYRWKTTITLKRIVKR
jgi:hypothetical protein